MPVTASTPGETRRAALRRSRPPLQPGRPVTEATTQLRQKYWDVFQRWVADSGIDLQYMLDNHFQCVDEINFLLSRYGRLLYNSGKSYNQYAETINSLSARKPAIRRMLQQSWDLGYSWVRSEPSAHHVAMPVPIVLAMMTVSLMWGWPFLAGIIALGFGGLLRPGEMTAALRKDLLLPSDVDFTATFALLAIREPKSRYTFARHQSAKVDSSDLVQVLELVFSRLDEGCRLWPYSPQTLRTRFKAVLAALKLPAASTFDHRCLDLGSLRSGGATFIIQSTEDSELCRRRGRWASHKMMDIYVQETMALQYMKMISSQAKQLVLETARCFLPILDKTKRFRQAQIHETFWFQLLSRWKQFFRCNKRVEWAGEAFTLTAGNLLLVICL